MSEMNVIIGGVAGILLAYVPIWLYQKREYRRFCSEADERERRSATPDAVTDYLRGIEEGQEKTRAFWFDCMHSNECSRKTAEAEALRQELQPGNDFRKPINITLCNFVLHSGAESKTNVTPEGKSEGVATFPPQAFGSFIHSTTSKPAAAPLSLGGVAVSPSSSAPS